MKRLLLVEDDPITSDLLSRKLGIEYEVAAAASLKDAESQLEKSRFNLVVLDANLPDGNGFRFCSKLRSQPRLRDLPIILLTGHAELEDKIMGFSQGADDFLGKPFQFEELRLRIAALLKRAEGKGAAAGSMELHGDIKFDTRYQRAVVARDSREIELSLTSIEFKLLYHLASQDGRICSREELIREIWGNDVHVTMRTVDSHLSNLRKKLDPSGWTVRAVHGEGYHWAPKRKQLDEAYRKYL